MHTIIAFDPDRALTLGLAHLSDVGLYEDSRNGKVLVAPGPVATVYPPGFSRVSMCPLRDANPFFHLYEALWMLAGRDDVASVARFVPRMAEFSDNGTTLHGAYGYRWRYWFEYDQLNAIVGLFAKDKTTRRAVLSMWDPEVDPDTADGGGKDVPCNTHAYFAARNGVLDMTVCCRSNDAVWGAHGANVVHFAFLHEYMAGRIGMPVGNYLQFSNNYHAYVERPDVKKLLESKRPKAPEVATNQAMLDPTTPAFDAEVLAIVKGSLEGPCSSPFLAHVVRPMMLAHLLHRQGYTTQGASILANSKIDWHVAGHRWLLRRLTKQQATQEVR